MDEQAESEQKSSPPPHPKKLKILTTAAIYLGNIALGYLLNAIPPALEDIRLRYGANVNEISVVFTVELVLYCIGAITYGFVTKYVNRQRLVLVTLSGMAFALYVIPHCPTQLVFFVVGGVLGFFAGLYDASQVVWIIEIWQEEAGPFILAQHFFFAVGSNIPSILIAPFLTPRTSTSNLGSESRIYIPFTVLGAITTLALLFQALLFTFCRYYTPPMYVSEKSNDELTSANNLSPTVQQESTIDTTNVVKKSNFVLGIDTRKLQLIVITGLFLGAYQGMEVCTMQFIPIFGQYSDLKLTESASAYVLFGLTGMFAIGRALGVIVIFKVRPEIVISINFVLITIANVILLVWANDNLTMFWTGCLILGIGYSTMYPSFCAFMEKYLVFTNGIGSFICVVGSIFASVYPLIVGRLIEREAVVLTYTNFFSTVACILTMAWGYAVVRKVKTRV